MRFGSQSPNSTTPSPPRVTIPFPAESAQASPLAALIPGFLRRPTQSFSRPKTSRSRSSSIVATSTTTADDSAASTCTSTCTSSRPSSEDMGLLDDDPFACPWDLSKPIHSLPTSPLVSPTRETFLPLDTLGHAAGHSLRFPSLNNENDRIDEGDEEDTDILPLHRRDRSYTLKAHPRNATWKSDKLAFRDRPSLPPLSILAQQTIVVVAPKSSRARHFPSEPWDKDISELPPLPRAKSLSPVAQQRAEPPRRLSELNGGKQLPPLPHGGDAPSHPSPIAEEDEDGPGIEYDDEFDEEEDAFEYEECSAPPSSPDYSFLDDLEEEEEEEEEDALDETLPSGADGEKPQLSREILTASVAIAVSLVQESHGDMLRPPSQRPNTLSASPAPSSCLLPSPNFLPLPELSPRGSGSVSSGDAEGSVLSGNDGVDTYTSYWRNESQQASSSSTAARLPCSAHRHMSWDLTIQSPPHVTTKITCPSFSTNLDSSFLQLLHQTGRRALSFSLGDVNPYNTIKKMATSSRAQSYGAYPRQHQQQDFLAGHHSSYGANGAGRDMGRGDRDPFGRKSLDAGTAGDDRRRRVPYAPNSSALDDDDDEDEDEDDMDRYGAPERPTARRASESLRVPRQPSSRPSSSRSSASKLPPVPPLPSQYHQPAASPRPQASPIMSPTHSRNHSGSHHPPPSAFHAPPPHPATNPPTPSRPSFSRSASRNKTSNESTSSDDDVPLGRRIPTALTAQKSIRQKARDDRDRNAVRGRAGGLGLSNAPAPDELASKLLNVQQTGLERGRSMASSANVSRSASRHHTHGHPSPNMRRLEDQLQSYQISGEPKSLQHARSVRRSEDEYSASRPNPRPRLRSLGPSSERPAVADFAPPPMPSSRSRPVSPDRLHPPQGSTPTSRESSGRSLSHAPSQSRTRSRANTVSANDRNHHGDDHLRRARTVRDPHGQDGKSPLLAPGSQPGARLPSPSDHFAAPPLPASPMSPIKQTFADTEQLRIFIGDLQRFVNVEITSMTTADDVIEMVSSRGELDGRDWMLWELANEFGMERPIRDYERLADVFTSWNKESRLNALMLKQTPLAVSLSRKYLPNSSPTFSGWVQWEVKKGKWQKRWLELREHSLFLCKKDNGKDAVSLCSLSKFDAYVVKRVTKAPKPFVFAAKSCDSIAMFENPADCAHVFCCDPDDGKDWLEKILLARSYVLYRERNVLFRTQGAASAGNSTGASIQRSNTRRNPHQPLIPDVAPSLPAMPFQQSSSHQSRGNVFAEGSLLARPTPQF